MRLALMTATALLLASAASAQVTLLPRPLRPAGSPTAWVSAKDLSRITMSPGGNGSRVESCTNRGSVGGTFYQSDPAGRPFWFDDGFLGPDLPYFWFLGPTTVAVNLTASFQSQEYISHDEFTIYVVAYAHQFHTSGSNPDEPLSPHATPISFIDVGLAMGLAGSAGGAVAVGASAHWTPQDPAVWDFVEMPATSGDAKLHVWKLEHKGGRLSLSRDGGAPVTTACGTTAGLVHAPVIGHNGQNFPYGAFHGAICEWIFYDRAVTAVEDANNLMYLFREWRTPLFGG